MLNHSKIEDDYQSQRFYEVQRYHVEEQLLSIIDFVDNLPKPEILQNLGLEIAKLINYFGIEFTF